VKQAVPSISVSLLCSPKLPYQISVLLDFIGEAGIHAYDHSIRGFDVSKDEFKDIAHLLRRASGIY